MGKLCWSGPPYASPSWWISSIQMYIVERNILHAHVINVIFLLWFSGLVNGAMQISVMDTLSWLSHDIDSKVATVCSHNFNLSPLKFVNLFNFSLLMHFLLIFFIFIISSPLLEVHVFVFHSSYRFLGCTKFTWILFYVWC